MPLLSQTMERLVASTRKKWTTKDVKSLRTMARKRIHAANIARKLRRSEGALRQKAFSIGLSLDTRA